MCNPINTTQIILIHFGLIVNEKTHRLGDNLTIS